MREETLVAILALVLGAGGLAFVRFIVDAIRESRANAVKRRVDVVDDLERLRHRAMYRAERAEVVSSWWMERAGQLTFALTKAGVEVPAPYRPIPVIEEHLRADSPDSDSTAARGP